MHEENHSAGTLSTLLDAPGNWGKEGFIHLFLFND
jgi:hypothetical protein